MTEHKIVIKWDDIVKKQSTAVKEVKSQQEQAKEPREETKKPSNNDTLQMLKRVATTYAFAEQLAGVGVSYVANNYAIAGETLKAERLTTRFNNAKKYAQTGLGIGLSIATGNPLIIAMTAYSLAQQGIQLGLNNQRYIAELRVERERSAYYTERLVKNMSEVR